MEAMRTWTVMAAAGRRTPGEAAALTARTASHPGAVEIGCRPPKDPASPAPKVPVPGVLGKRSPNAHRGIRDHGTRDRGTANRVPVHVGGRVAKAHAVFATMTAEFGRNPTPEELAEGWVDNGEGPRRPLGAPRAVQPRALRGAGGRGGARRARRLPRRRLPGGLPHRSGRGSAGNRPRPKAAWEGHRRAEATGAHHRHPPLRARRRETAQKLVEIVMEIGRTHVRVRPILGAAPKRVSQGRSEARPPERPQGLRSRQHPKGAFSGHGEGAGRRPSSTLKRLAVFGLSTGNLDF